LPFSLPHRLSCLKASIAQNCKISLQVLDKI
jgi:hypothetical protein